VLLDLYLVENLYSPYGIQLAYSLAYRNKQQKRMQTNNQKVTTQKYYINYYTKLHNGTFIRQNQTDTKHPPPPHTHTVRLSKGHCTEVANDRSVQYIQPGKLKSTSNSLTNQ